MAIDLSDSIGLYKLTNTLYMSNINVQFNQGTVLAVGPGRRTNTGDIIPVAVKEGDQVLLPEYGGTQVKLDDKEYVIFLCIFH